MKFLVFIFILPKLTSDSSTAYIWSSVWPQTLVCNIWKRKWEKAWDASSLFHVLIFGIFGLHMLSYVSLALH